jgi:ABC-type antimicrobial peptide transport system permease subunit
MAAARSPAVIYLPLHPAEFARPALRGVTLMVRATPGVDALGAVRREIAAMDPNLTPFNSRSMTEQIDQLMFPVKVALYTYGCIGVFGLILASVGLAGVTAYSVAQRRREIGIRVALGAQPGDVLGLVMKEGVILIAIGTVFGLSGAWAGIRLLSAFMSTVARTAGTSTSDPLLLVGAPLLLAALALGACYVPARKSMRIDPAVALRQE